MECTKKKTQHRKARYKAWICLESLNFKRKNVEFIFKVATLRIRGELPASSCANNKR